MSVLSILPENPLNTGWPWTEETPAEIYAGESWPKISIVTPSYNQGKYLEETIRSILLQNYPNLEYIIIDGGSNDETLAIIKKYAAWITYWVSEKDGGQPQAINKGLKIANGEVFNWINSDDYLAPGALHIIATEYKKGFDLLAGCVNNFQETPTDTFIHYSGIIQNRNLSIAQYFNKAGGFYFHQPGVWIKRALLNDMPVSEQLHYCFDTQLMLNLLEKKPIVKYKDKVLVNFRLHDGSKTVSVLGKFLLEFEELHKTYLHHPDPEIASAAKLFLEDRKWRAYLNGLQKESLSRLKKAKLILKGLSGNPYSRFNRFTFGALKKVLFS